ncbi:hypothetical protein RUND412_000337 [Rhizina undulata]
MASWTLTRTLQYLQYQLLIAVRYSLHGYGAFFLLVWLGFGCYQTYAEYVSPTPESFDFITRTKLRRATSYNPDIYPDFIKSGSTPQELVYLSQAIERLDFELERPGHWEKVDENWRKGYIDSLRRLAVLDEKLERNDEALKVYEKLVSLKDLTPGKDYADTQVYACLRASKILEYEGHDTRAEEMLHRAISFAEQVSKPLVRPSSASFSEKTDTTMVPDDVAPKPLLLKAKTELAVFYARHDNFPEALAILLSILQSRRSVAAPADPGRSVSAEKISDPCAEASTMTYIGEILFALGEKRQGVAWTSEAFEKAVPLKELRGACKDCAIISGQNAAKMIGLLKDEIVENAEKPKFWRLWKEDVEGTVKELKKKVEQWEKAVGELETIRITRGT